MHIDINKYGNKPTSQFIIIYLFTRTLIFPHSSSIWVHACTLNHGTSCASTTLLAHGPTYKPISLVVLLHGLLRPSSKLLARTQTRIPAFPTMNSLGHSILKFFEHEINSLAHSSQQEYLRWTKLFMFRMCSTHHELLARDSNQARPRSFGLSPSSPTHNTCI